MSSSQPGAEEEILGVIMIQPMCQEPRRFADKKVNFIILSGEGATEHAWR